MKLAKSYVIHGEQIGGEPLERAVELIRSLSLHLEKYGATASLNYIKDGEVQSKRPFTGQAYATSDKYVVDPKGWNHDHCEVCWWTIEESDDPEIGEGYTDGLGMWICKECHDLFVDDEQTTQSL